MEKAFASFMTSVGYGLGGALPAVLLSAKLLGLASILMYELGFPRPESPSASGKIETIIPALASVVPLVQEKACMVSKRL